MAYPKVADYSWTRPDPKALRLAGYEGVVRYGPGRADAVHITKAEVDALRAAGLAIAIVIQPAKDFMLRGFAAGVIEAKRSQAITRTAGLPDGDVYAAVDFDATGGGTPNTTAELAQMEQIAQTFLGIASVIGQDHVRPYGGYHVLTWLYRRLPWLKAGWQPELAWSLVNGAPVIHPNAALVQHSPSVSLAGGLIDHNDVLVPSWGQRTTTSQEAPMGTVTVDHTTQRYTSSVQPEPDILLLHTTEGMGWPGYNGGGTAPHDTVEAIRGVGIRVRRHYPYDHNAKALRNESGGVQTNRRGVIQVELKGTCDPKYRGNASWYFWPDADDAVLSALADYYRPIMARYGIPAKAMAEFVAYPKSYGINAAQRLSQSAWNNGAGICGHQHAPENSHGDPGNFPVARFIRFLLGNTPPAPTPPAPTKPDPTSPDWSDMATLEEIKQAFRDVLNEKTTDQALFTKHAILKDVSANDPETAPRVTPSRAIEIAGLAALGKLADDTP